MPPGALLNVNVPVGRRSQATRSPSSAGASTATWWTCARICAAAPTTGSAGPEAEAEDVPGSDTNAVRAAAGLGDAAGARPHRAGRSSASCARWQRARLRALTQGRPRGRSGPRPGRSSRAERWRRAERRRASACACCRGCWRWRPQAGCATRQPPLHPPAPEGSLLRRRGRATPWTRSRDRRACRSRIWPRSTAWPRMRPLSEGQVIFVLAPEPGVTVALPAGTAARREAARGHRPRRSAGRREAAGGAALAAARGAHLLGLRPALGPQARGHRSGGAQRNAGAGGARRARAVRRRHAARLRQHGGAAARGRSAHRLRPQLGAAGAGGRPGAGRADDRPRGADRTGHRPRTCTSRCAGARCR